MLKFSSKTHRIILFFCTLTLFCFNLAANAQSRRRSRQKPDEQTAPVESKTPPADNKTDDEIDETPARIASLKIVGEVQHNAAFYKSNDLDNALKEFIRFLKLTSKAAPAMTRGGKATYAEAEEPAKKESDAFVLWLGFTAQNDGYGNMYIDVVQYAVIKPRTGEILTRGETRPGQTQSVSPGVRLPAPTVSRRGAVGMRDETNDSARRIAAILARGGWLG